jgi:hypothetical protein
MCDGRVRVRQAQCGQSTSMRYIEDTVGVRSLVDVQSAVICAWAPPANAGDLTGLSATGALGNPLPM